MKQKIKTGIGFEFALIYGDNLCFPAHSHDEYVISSNIIGHENLQLDGKNFVAHEGVTTLFNPGQMHVGEGTSFLMSLYLDQDFFPQYQISQMRLEFEQELAHDYHLIQAMKRVVTPVLEDASAAELSEHAMEVIDLLVPNYTVAKSEKIPEKTDWRVKMIEHILLDQLDRIPDTTELAAYVGLTPTQMFRLFKKANGVPPLTWQRMHRLAKARRLLRKGERSASVATQVGFADQAHLVRTFGKAYGITPERYRSAGL